MWYPPRWDPGTEKGDQWKKMGGIQMKPGA